MEKYPRVTCEVCGQTEIVDVPSTRDIYKAIDLWTCEHCIYVFAFIEGHVRQAQHKCEQQGDMNQLQRAMNKIEKVAKLYPINSALPRINNIQPYCKRIDSLIVDEDT